MEKNFVINADEMQVQDGKIIVSSEELANAIQNQMIDMDGEEEAGAFISVQVHCSNA